MGVLSLNCLDGVLFVGSHELTLLKLGAYFKLNIRQSWTADFAPGAQFATIQILYDNYYDPKQRVMPIQRLRRMSSFAATKG